MSKTPKSDEPNDVARENTSDQPDNSSWSRDQEDHGYYYDDSHGYEVYDPALDDEKEDPSHRGPDPSED